MVLTSNNGKLSKKTSKNRMRFLQKTSKNRMRFPNGTYDMASSVVHGLVYIAVDCSHINQFRVPEHIECSVYCTSFQEAAPNNTYTND